MTPFQVGKNKIARLGNNFKEWFAGMDDTPKKCKFACKTLVRPMLDKEILAELRPQPFSLGEVAWIVENSDKLLTNGYANIFYVENKNKELCAVHVCWGSDGWNVYACSFGCPDEWGSGRLVFSRDSFDILELPEEMENFMNSMLEIDYFPMLVSVLDFIRTEREKAKQEERERILDIIRICWHDNFGVDERGREFIYKKQFEDLLAKIKE